MEKKPLTRQQYLKAQGLKCPQCHADGVEGNDVEINAGRAFQNCNCTSCGATWTDCYDLTGYDNLEK